MTLQIGLVSLPVAQLGPDFLIVEKTMDHAPTEGAVILEVDGQVRVFFIHIPGGMQEYAEEVLICSATPFETQMSEISEAGA